MRILPRYVLGRFLAAFVGVLAILVLSITVIEMLVHLDEILETHAGWTGALTYVGLRIPSYYLPYLLPVASFGAAFLAFGLPARGLEVVAMKAGGLSPLRIVVPVLVAAAAISALALVLNETLAVEASKAWRRHVRGDASEVAFRRGSFWYQRGRRIYNVREADPAHQSLRGVTVFELDGRGRLVRSVHAERAEIAEAGVWRLHDATIRRFDPDVPAAGPDFERVKETRLILAAEPELALLDADVSTLSIMDLREYLQARGVSEASGMRAQAFFHERLTAPLIVLLFALLGIPLGLRVEQTRTLARPALHGLVLLFLFYTVRQYGSTLALQGVTSPMATPWTVLALFSSFGVWQLAAVRH